jgi:hypothetical protein
MPELLEDPAIYVIRRGDEEYGPFGRDTLREAMEMGNLVGEDWVRTIDRTACWVSLYRLLNTPPPPVPPMVMVRRIVARGLKVSFGLGNCLLSAANQTLDRCSARMVNHPALLAFACIMAATAIVFLPGQPLGISIPWMLGGAAAGIAMFLSRRSFGGVLACLFSVLLPFGASRAIPLVNEYLDPNHLENALPPIGEMYSTMPRRAGESHRSNARARSGIPALGLPQPALVANAEE